MHGREGIKENSSMTNAKTDNSNFLTGKEKFTFLESLPFSLNLTRKSIFLIIVNTNTGYVTRLEHVPIKEMCKIDLSYQL